MEYPADPNTYRIIKRPPTRSAFKYAYQIDFKKKYVVLKCAICGKLHNKTSYTRRKEIIFERAYYGTAKTEVCLCKKTIYSSLSHMSMNYRDCMGVNNEEIFYE